MGAVEEGGRVATAAVDALKGNPICIVVMIISLAFAILTFYALQADRERTHNETLELYQRCFPLQSKEKY